MNIRADSTEYVKSTVTVDHDISTADISVALPVTGVAPSVWFLAEVTGTSNVGGNWTSTYRILVGPAGGAVALTAGTYDWTVKIEDNPEVPVRKAGVVVVTAS